jgi:prepilin-type N-terminal cleavage/methylation domain-containing protein
MKRRKGFTLVELLVVIGIIALLVSILMPALGKAKELAKQIMCGSQLSGLGKSVMMYENDYKEQSPKGWSVQTATLGVGSGLYNDLGGATPTVRTRWASGVLNTEIGRQTIPTIGQCLYLLVRKTDVDPKAFVCPSAPNDTPMRLTDAQLVNPAVTEWTELGDFQGGGNLSYSYNEPWDRHCDSSAQSSLALMADKSLVTDTPTLGINPLTTPNPNTGDNIRVGTDAFSGTWDNTPILGQTALNVRYGNSNNHQTRCQNVLFYGTHVTKPTTPLVGIGGDNIYTAWSGQQSLPYIQPMIGFWGRVGHGPDITYDSALGTRPSDTDSYLCN